MKPETIKIDEVEYIRKDAVKCEAAPKVDGLEYCIIRTYSAGVFAGYIDRAKGGKEQTIYNSRRIWAWSGAASLSQLAMEGTKDPDNCKFPREVTETDLTEIIEVIPCTIQAEESIKGVKVWQK